MSANEMLNSFSSRRTAACSVGGRLLLLSMRANDLAQTSGVLVAMYAFHVRVPPPARVHALDMVS